MKPVRDPITPPAPRTVRRSALRAGAHVAAIAAILLLSSRARAQVPGMMPNPVYVDDSTAAQDAQVRVRELVSAGNVDEAVRVLQMLLDEHADRVVSSQDDAELSVSVRDRVHETVLKDAKLLDRYRAIVESKAQAALSELEPSQVERRYLLTSAGFEAALRVAQRQLEDAEFEAARLTLAQLDTHPDASAGGSGGGGAGGNGAGSIDQRRARAASVWTLLAQYLDRPEVRASRDRWRTLAKLDANAPKPVEWPQLAQARARTMFEPLPELSSDGLVAKPLWTVAYTAPPGGEGEGGGGARGGGGGGGGVSIHPLRRSLHVLPCSAGDLLLISDGASLTAWDRFTLSVRWTFASDGLLTPTDLRDEDRMRNERWGGYGGMHTGEDPACVSVSGRLAMVATGRATPSSAGDDRVSGLDLNSGRVLWSSRLKELDPSLVDGAVRGPVEIVENTCVLGVRKLSGERRLVGLSLVGVDTRTGAAKWTRPVASTGSMPWVTLSSGTEAMLAHRGVVYRSDKLGVIAAVEASSGRVVWVRRMPVDPTIQNDIPQPYEFGKPAIDDKGALLCLSPDGRLLVRLDAQSGKVLLKRPLADLGVADVRYFLRVGDHLAMVTRSSVWGIAIAQIEGGQARLLLKLDEPGVRGRVLVTGGKLLVPMATGVRVVDPSAPSGTPPGVIDLDEPGNVLALDSQLVVVDDARAHSFLKWDTAQSLLQTRLKNDPSDVQSAITLAELAFRAEKVAEVQPAIDASLAALSRLGTGEAALTGRKRLFSVLHRMTLTWADQASGLRAAAPAKPENKTDSKPENKPDMALLSRCVERMGELAGDDTQKLAHALALGRVAELGARTADAAAAYQRIIQTQELATANWRGRGVTVRGELEASRRLEDLLKNVDPGAYSAVDAQAAAELAGIGGLGASAGATTFSALALKYPFARQTPAVWARAAEMHNAQGNVREALAALEAGMRSGQRVRTPDLEAMGRIAGTLVTALRSRGQLAAASGVLRTVKMKFPGATLSAQGQPIDADALGAELLRTIAQAQRWPKVGAIKSEIAQAMEGWMMLEPLLKDPAPSTQAGLVMVNEEQIAMWSRPESPGKESLQKGWSIGLDKRDAILVKISSDAAYVLLIGDKSIELARVAPGNPEAKWTVDITAGLRGGDDHAATRGLQRVPGVMADRFDTPTEYNISPEDLLIAMDERTAVLAQRTGNMLGIDLESGTVIWAAPSLLTRVHDCDLSAGWLVLAGYEGGGEDDAPVDVGALDLVKPAALIFDSRSGRLSQRAQGLTQTPHWVKIAESGAIIVGSGAGVTNFDPWTGRANWSLAAAGVSRDGQDADEQGSMLPAAAAWTMGDHLILLTPDRKLALASIATGRLHPEPLSTPKSLLDGARIVDVYPLGVGPTPGFAVSTQQGVAFFSSEGALIGADGLSGMSSIVPPKPAEGQVLTIETISEGRGDEGMMYFSLLGFQSPSGIATDKRALLMGSRPTDITLLDGLIVVSTGTVTVVLEAPAE